MSLFVVFAMTESNKDVPTVVFVGTEWDQVVKALREKIGDLVNTFVKQTIDDIDECADEDYDDMAELSVKFGWAPNFDWNVRHYVDVPATLWKQFMPSSYFKEGTLVVYKSYNRLDLIHSDGPFDIV